jgi:XTP/dITP diphosphohydrolase
MELVFATNNNHKLRELQEILGKRFVLKSLSDIGCSDDIPETCDTLEGNASQKAFYIYNKYGVNCFADDTGLEVEALGNAPGVISARYAGEQRNPVDNVNKLLGELDKIINRKARFRTVISLLIDGQEQLFEGIAEGEIIDTPRGKQGFGYDPVFRPSGYYLTFAEMEAEEKNRISHRGKAVEKLVSYLKQDDNIRL